MEGREQRGAARRGEGDRKIGGRKMGSGGSGKIMDVKLESLAGRMKTVCLPQSALESWNLLT